MSDVADMMATEKEEYESYCRRKKEKEDIIRSLKEEIEYYKKKENKKKLREAEKMLRAIEAYED
jgi:hypothetical protein